MWVNSRWYTPRMIELGEKSEWWLQTFCINLILTAHFSLVWFVAPWRKFRESDFRLPTIDSNSRPLSKNTTSSSWHVWYSIPYSLNSKFNLRIKLLASWALSAQRLHRTAETLGRAPGGYLVAIVIADLLRRWSLFGLDAIYRRRCSLMRPAADGKSHHWVFSNTVHYSCYRENSKEYAAMVGHKEQPQDSETGYQEESASCCTRVWHRLRRWSSKPASRRSGRTLVEPLVQCMVCQTQLAIEYGNDTVFIGPHSVKYIPTSWNG